MNTTRFNKMHFGLYDKKGSIFVDYLWSTSFSDVMRHFHYLVNQSGTILNLYSRDFCVYLLGSIDDATGEYVAESPFTLVHECSDLLASIEQIEVESEVEDEVSH